MINLDKFLNRKNRFISLNLKITAVIMVGILMAILMYVVSTYVEATVANHFYLSDSAVKKSSDKAYDSLESYIDAKNVKATDSQALSDWLKERDYTYLFVYDNYNNVFEAGWWSEDTHSSETDPLADEESTVSENVDDATNGKRIDKGTFTSDAQNRIVHFEDGEYYVYISYYGEQRWYRIMKIVQLVLCFLTLFLTMLIYNGSLITRVGNLSLAVQDISDGNYKREIKAAHNDEIGKLAMGVDTMRNSILEKLQNEQNAWEANTQLITSMSHDIRTPLTSLIGYLDIIEGKKYKDEEELDKFIGSCRDKAFQLKDLSDKLFQYFLVFGSQGVERTTEILDASILFQQLMVEHVAEITSYGFTVNLRYEIPEVLVSTDPSGLHRLFDNLFSNIMKYADKKVPIDIEALYDGNSVHLNFTNLIAEEAKKVESTHIGVKTCERICNDLGGEFVADENKKIYTTKISFPVVEKEPESEEENSLEVGETEEK